MLPIKSFVILLFATFLTLVVCNGSNRERDPDFGSLENFAPFPKIWENSKPKPNHPSSMDPLLAQVNAEIERLGLEDYSDDYFDHLEDKSEEVRSFIWSRQRGLIAKEKEEASSTMPPTIQASTSTSEEEEEQVTQFPILTPGPQEITKRPGMFGSLVKTVKKGAKLVATPIIYAGNSIIGKRSTPTNPSPTAAELPPPENFELAPRSLPKCNLTSQIEFQGECVNLLTSDKCPTPSQWLVEDPATLAPTCAPNPCHGKQNEASFGGQCIHVGTDKPCGPGMRTYVYRSGLVECDCNEGYLFNKGDGHCYSAYKQGPCAAGQYFVLPKTTASNKDKKKEPVCLPNPCRVDGNFCPAPRCPQQRGCAKLGDKCGDLSIYIIDQLTFIPVCRSLQKIIGNVPTLSCAPGSRRDILGNCRTPTTIDFS